MKFKDKEIDKKEIFYAVLSVAIGTGSGLLVYGFFLYFNIAIFGWNLGLIFAPLAAGYVETIIANRTIGENIGAISAFILFIDTTFYSFILKNPTLGWNIITAGSIVVILQAAFPTLINYLLLLVIGGFISFFYKTLKRIGRKIKKAVQNQKIIGWEGSNEELETDFVQHFDEKESNEKINELDFYFITSSHMNKIKHENLGIFHSEIILEKDRNLIRDPELYEFNTLVNLKEGKDECLIKLAKKIKDKGGNGILDLSLRYSLTGMGGDHIQISAMGMGIYIH
jgi:hypothetical protein